MIEIRARSHNLRKLQYLTFLFVDFYLSLPVVKTWFSAVTYTVNRGDSYFGKRRSGYGKKGSLVGLDPKTVCVQPQAAASGRRIIVVVIVVSARQFVAAPVACLSQLGRYA